MCIRDSINVSGVGQRLDFYTGDSGSNTANLTSAHRRMSLTAQGRLGIGTDNPNNPLTIHASGNHIYLKDTATDNNLQIRSSGGVAEFNSFGTSGARRDFVFNQYTSEVLRITSGGNIGIGTTNPGSKLAVHGSITESTDGVTYYPVVTQQDVGLDQNQIPLNQNLGGMAYMDTSNYEQVFEIPATDVTSYFKEGTENIYIGMEGHCLLYTSDAADE